MYLGISPSKFDELRKANRVAPPKFSTAASYSLSRDWMNFSMRFPMKTKPIMTTGRLRYDQGSVPVHAPKTTARLHRGP